MRGLGTARPVVLAKAVEMWWKWLGKYVIGAVGQDEWIEWLWEMFSDLDGFGESSSAQAWIISLIRCGASDLATISKSGTDASEVLFEVESPNLFRDSLVNVEHAVNILISFDHFGLLSAEHCATLTAFHRRAEAAILALPDTSPIDDAWEAQRVLCKRLTIQRKVFDSTKQDKGGKMDKTEDGAR